MHFSILQGRNLFKILKCAQERRSEPLSQPGTVTIYGEGDVPLFKPHLHSLKAATREKWVTF